MTANFQTPVEAMQYALQLSRRAEGRTHPNPMVGAVLVRDGVIVGEGWHNGPGTPHAETMAFTQAGELARGATLYVTLEPCSFYFSSNGQPRIPCTQRCLDAGVSHVVCAMQDPDVRVNGNGFEQLRQAGITVTVGICEAEARQLNAPFIRHRTTGLPFITHKAAMTLDGKIAAPPEEPGLPGDSRWVTGNAAREYVHRLRSVSDAIVVGIGTVLADNPQLTVRLPQSEAEGEGVGNARDPLRVILDSRLRLPLTANVARTGTVVLTTENTEVARRREHEAAGVTVIPLPADENGRVDVTAAARWLADNDKYRVLLEAGGTLAEAFWRTHLINKVLFFIAPKIIGGATAATPIDGSGLGTRMAEARSLGPIQIHRFGDDIALEADVK